MSRSQEYLRDILEAMEKAERYLERISFEEFAADTEKQDAVEWNLSVIGEAAKQIQPALRQENDDVPWSDMARMRDRIVHRYFSIDLEVLWKTAKERIPKAKALLQQMLRELEQEEAE